jgi:hypothetical protein
MRIALSAGLAALACSCVATPDSSNQPDSGVDCSLLAPDAGGLVPGVPNGSGTFSGALSFPIQAAYETHETTMSLPYKLPDGGSAPVINGSYLSVLMYGAPIVCGAPNDGGQPEVPVIWLILTDSTGAYPGGDYLVQRDGGNLGADALIASPFDGGFISTHSASGTVHLATPLTCSLSGSFDLQLALEDGGTQAASGTFAAPYCK